MLKYGHLLTDIILCYEHKYIDETVYMAPLGTLGLNTWIISSFYTQERFALQRFKIQNYKVAIWAVVQGPVHDKGVIGMRLEGQIHHHIVHRELPVVCATMHSQPPF